MDTVRTTGLAEVSLRCLSPPKIESRRFFQWFGHGKGKVRLWHDQVDIPTHGTIGTIAVPGDQTLRIGPELRLDATAVTADGELLARR
jgi:hypothetical protein